MARRIVGGAFVSLDGVLQAPGGPDEDPTGGFAHGGWLTGFFDEALGRQVDTLFTPPFDLLLGRRTYDIFAAHWPYQDDAMGTLLDGVGKYVLTRSDRSLDWHGSTRLTDLDALAALKAEDGPDLVIQGSATLYPQLLARGLLDRLVLMTAPVVLGRGKRLFGDGTPPGAWRLVEHRTGTAGVTMATYEPAGVVETGSFAAQPPSAAEMDRRRRLSEEDGAPGRWDEFFAEPGVDLPPREA